MELIYDNKLVGSPSIIFPTEIIQAALLGSAMYVLLVSGDLYMSLDQEGAIDCGETSQVNWDKQYRLILTDVKKISYGDYHLLILKKTGHVYGLGYCHYKSKHRKSKLGFLFCDDQIEDIECSNYHTIFHRRDGQIYGFGLSTDFQLGKKNLRQKFLEKFGWDIYNRRPQLVGCVPNIIQVCCTNTMTAILDTNGNVYAVGTIYSKMPSNLYIPAHSYSTASNLYSSWFTLFELKKIISATKSFHTSQMTCNDSTIFLYQKDGAINEFGEKFRASYPKIPDLVIFKFQRDGLNLVTRQNILYRFCPDDYSGVTKFCPDDHSGITNWSNISSFANAPSRQPANWSTDIHWRFPRNFRTAIYHFYLALKRIYRSTKLRLPKFVVYEIVKKII